MVINYHHCCLFDSQVGLRILSLVRCELGLLASILIANGVILPPEKASSIASDMSNQSAEVVNDTKWGIQSLFANLVVAFDLKFGDNYNNIEFPKFANKSFSQSDYYDSLCETLVSDECQLSFAPACLDGSLIWTIGDVRYFGNTIIRDTLLSVSLSKMDGEEDTSLNGAVAENVLTSTAQEYIKSLWSTAGYKPQLKDFYDHKIPRALVETDSDQEYDSIVSTTQPGIQSLARSDSAFVEKSKSMKQSLIRKSLSDVELNDVLLNDTSDSSSNEEDDSDNGHVDRVLDEYQIANNSLSSLFKDIINPFPINFNSCFKYNSLETLRIDDWTDSQVSHIAIYLLRRVFNGDSILM